MNYSIRASVIHLALLGCMTILGSTNASAAMIALEDHFDEGIISDWSLSSSYESGDFMQLAGTLPDQYLQVGLTKPPGGPTIQNQWSVASQTFNADIAGDYTLDFNAQTSICNGCSDLTWTIYLDGVIIEEQIGTAWQGGSITLPSLDGIHTIGLGVWTDNINNGTVFANFDDVVISTSVVPLPTAIWLFGSGLIGLIGIARRKKA